jgi:hypothetical protein
MLFSHMNTVSVLVLDDEYPAEAAVSGAEAAYISCFVCILLFVV